MTFLSKLNLGQPAVAGAAETSSRKAARLDFDAEATRIYYVKFYPKTHALYFELQLSLADDAVGEREIKACKLVLAKKSK